MTEALLTGQTATPTEGQTATTPQTAPTQQPAGTAQVSTKQQSAEGAKLDGGKVATDPLKQTSDNAGKPQGAPERYEFKPPAEGGEFDAQVLSKYAEVAKELNLPQEAAQKMLDRLAPAMQARQAQIVEETRNAWVTSSKSDKEFGGDQLLPNLAIAKKALDSFGTPELRKLLDDSGLGNHPEVIRMMYRAGKAISEDRFVGGSQGAQKGSGFRSMDDLANALYASQNK